MATPDEIFDRVTKDESGIERPLLSVPDPRQRIVELLAERSPDYRRFAQLTTDTVDADAVAADLAALARSDPHRFAIDNPAGGYEFSVGAAVLPFVRQLARIDGPMVVVTNTEVGDLYLASCGDVDLDRHAAERDGRPEEPGRRSTRLRRVARRQRRSVGHDRLAR